MIKLTNEEILQDALIAEKFMVTMYDQFLKESSNLELLNLLLDHYEELAEIQHEIFAEMKDRDLYPVENAEVKKIDETLKLHKEKYIDYHKSF